MTAALLWAGAAWAGFEKNYEGDVDPGTDGWTLGGGGTPWSLVVEEGATCLYQEANAANSAYWFIDPPTGLSASEDLVIEARMKIGYDWVETQSGRFYASYLTVSNGQYVYGHGVNKSEDGVLGSGGQPGHPSFRMMDSRAQPYWNFDDLDPALDDGFHTYRWEVSGADPGHYDFWIDGLLGADHIAGWGGHGDIPTGVSKTDSDYRIIWGDADPKAGVNVWYDYIRITNGAGAPTPKNRGDVTEDGFVGADDLVRILSNWGESGAGVTWAMGDVAPYNDGINTGDQFIGADDYVEVLTFWGTNYGGPEPTPEPTTILIVGLGACLALLKRRMK